MNNVEDTTPGSKAAFLKSKKNWPIIILIALGISAALLIAAVLIVYGMSSLLLLINLKNPIIPLIILYLLIAGAVVLDIEFRVRTLSKSKAPYK